MLFFSSAVIQGAVCTDIFRQVIPLIQCQESIGNNFHFLNLDVPKRKVKSCCNAPLSMW